MACFFFLVAGFSEPEPVDEVSSSPLQIRFINSEPGLNVARVHGILKCDH